MQYNKLLNFLKDIYTDKETDSLIPMLAEATHISEATLYRWNNDEELKSMKTKVSSNNCRKLIDFIAERKQIGVQEAIEKLNELDYDCFKKAEYKTLEGSPKNDAAGDEEKENVTTEAEIHESDAVEVEEKENVTTEAEIHENDAAGDEEKENVTTEAEIHESDAVEVEEKENVTTEAEIHENDAVEVEEKENVTTEHEGQGLKPHICIALEQLLDRMEFEIITSEFVSGEECILWEVECKQEERLKKKLFYEENPDILKKIMQVNVTHDNYNEKRQWVGKCGFDKKGFIFVNCENTDICEKVKADKWSKQNLLFIGIEGKPIFMLGNLCKETKKLWKYIQEYI